MHVDAYAQAGNEPTPAVKPVASAADALHVPLWQPMDATLPDLNNPYWRSPLELQNFQYPYSKMDIPTPKPQHADPTARPLGPAARARARRAEAGRRPADRAGQRASGSVRHACGGADLEHRHRG